jgi:hypothetical protein
MIVATARYARLAFFALALAAPGLAAADTASCLRNCDLAFAACKKGAISTADLAECFKQRKNCVNGCAAETD